LGVLLSPAQWHGTIDCISTGDLDRAFLQAERLLDVSATRFDTPVNGYVRAIWDRSSTQAVQRISPCSRCRLRDLAAATHQSCTAPR
jgi:hypothetical protein